MKKRIARKVTSHFRECRYSRQQEDSAYRHGAILFPGRRLYGGESPSDLLTAVLHAYQQSDEAAREALVRGWARLLPVLRRVGSDDCGREKIKGTIRWGRTFEAGLIRGAEMAAVARWKASPEESLVDAVIRELQYLVNQGRLAPHNVGAFTAFLQVLDPGYGISSYVEAVRDRRACPFCEQPLWVVREPYGPGPRRIRLADAGDRWCPCLGTSGDTLYWADQLDALHALLDAGARGSFCQRHRVDPLPRRYVDDQPRMPVVKAPEWTDADRAKLRAWVARKSEPRSVAKPA